ncbi:MAG: yhfK 1 [Candidatus Saccharibacteria bacterium]|nr:yhfK 1 [Candidatus Saccharibacteria bacterium]
MKLLILGAAGRTGALLVNQALAAGHTVTGFVRGSDGTTIEIPGITTIVGDARNVADLEKALKGQDAVISTLGSSKPGDRVIAASTKSLITAAKSQGVKRVIMMSSFLATQNFQPNPIVKFALRLMGSIVADINSGEGQLRGSDLDYTIVYATRLTNEPLNPHYRIVSETEKVGTTDSISRADVAEFLLKQLSDITHVRKSVLITDN